MRPTLPNAVVRAGTRLLAAPALSGRLPLPLARRLTDLQGRLLPAPRGTRTRRAELGGRPALWVTAAGTAADGVLLHLHGGGYLLGSPASHRSFAGWLAEAAGVPVALPHYRRAPEHPHPAAVDDAEQAYLALLAAGHSPQRLALSGDSAGAGIVLALLLRLRGRGAPLPATVGLVSPWLDLSLTDPALTANRRSDVLLGAGLLHAGVAGYLRGGPFPAELRPLEADLSGLPPLHVVAGERELLVGDADRLVAAVRAAGGRVSYRRSPGMWHDHVLEAGLLARGRADLQELGQALRRDLAARRVRVAVVGSGFGGIAMAAALRADDPADVTVLEKADRAGGVWRDNTYPGAACDVPSHLYSYSFAQGREWSHRYATQPDILGYLERVAAERGVDAVTRFGTEVTDAVWDAGAALWRLRTSRGEIEAEVLVPACGQLARPAIPDLPGADRFAGPVFHSARWDHTVDLRGKRIAVVGTGASAVQLVPEIAREAAALTVFQRNAAWVLPRIDAVYGPRAHRLFARFPLWHRLSRLGWTAFFETGTLGLTRWRGLAAAFRLVHRAALRRAVADPELRARLDPGYPMGCKRVLFSSDWFRTLAQPHVTLVTEKVVAVTEDGLRTADGALHPCDVLILATGFHSQDYVAPMRVVGRDGRELADAWRDGAQAHLGMTVPGFPNLFLLYGPHTNLGSGSIVRMLECQVRYAREAVRLLTAGARTVEVRPEVAAAHEDEMQRRLATTVWTHCTSWYRTPAGRITTNWPGTMREYDRRTATLAPADFTIAP